MIQSRLHLQLLSVSVLALVERSVAQVNLGTAASFGIVANQAITNTGDTIVSGSLGLYPNPRTSITGFPPGVSGSIFAAEAVANQALQDAQTAYTAASNQPSTAQISGADLGGQTLIAGTYTSSSAVEITGTLTLDGGNDPDAVFVFQIGFTLITASSSTVKLINGARACNVLWQIGSSATLGTDSVFVGNILAFTSITLQSNVDVTGGLYALNAAVTLINDKVTAQGQCAVLATGSSVPDTTSTTPTVASSVPGGGATVTTDGTSTAATMTTTTGVSTAPGDIPGTNPSNNNPDVNNPPVNNPPVNNPPVNNPPINNPPVNNPPVNNSPADNPPINNPPINNPPINNPPINNPPINNPPINNPPINNPGNHNPNNPGQSPGQPTTTAGNSLPTDGIPTQPTNGLRTPQMLASTSLTTITPTLIENIMPSSSRPQPNSLTTSLSNSTTSKYEIYDAYSTYTPLTSSAINVTYPANFRPINTQPQPVTAANYHLTTTTANHNLSASQHTTLTYYDRSCSCTLTTIVPASYQPTPTTTATFAITTISGVPCTTSQYYERTCDCLRTSTSPLQVVAATASIDITIGGVPCVTSKYFEQACGCVQTSTIPVRIASAGEAVYPGTTVSGAATAATEQVGCAQTAGVL
jgi:hypothetical protein